MKFLLTNTESSRLLFRKIQNDDFEPWLPFFEDPKTHLHWIDNYKSPDLECEQWYRRQFERYEKDLGGMNAIIEKESGKLIGHCGLLVQTVDDRNELEIAYSLLPAFWGKGFATEAAAHCRDQAFQNNFSESLISIISVNNAASIRVAIKNGMTKTREAIYKRNTVNIFRITKNEWLQNLPPVNR